MIANADTQKVIFLSVARDGSMEAFDNIDEAIRHASARVKDGDTERAIFVAVPRAHVHRTVRIDPVDPLPVPSERKATQDTSARERHWELPKNPVHVNGIIDPVDPLPMPEPEQKDTGQILASERVQDRERLVDGDPSAIEEHNVADEDRDNKSIAPLEASLVSLEARLRHAQVDYRRACARGDDERINHARLRINAITAEQNRLMKNLSDRRSGTVWPTSTPLE